MRALISTYDKRGLVALGTWLSEHSVSLVATGGTAATLTAAGLTVEDTERTTGFAELVGGRVKTLHPGIFAGILADGSDGHQAQLQAAGIEPIDVVICNLYPFRGSWLRGEEAEQLVEQVDIGGVALIRAAAKNFARVVVLCDPLQYDEAMVRGLDGWDAAYRRDLAAYAFRQVAAYDADIAHVFTGWTGALWPERLTVTGDRLGTLRYGENPQQEAAVYRVPGVAGWGEAPPLQGKTLSYNNWADAEAAWRLVWDLPAPGAVGLKHQTPCGVALGAPAARAWELVQAADPVSIFGGIVAFNQPLDADAARALVDGGFLEVILAPVVAPEALPILAEKPNLRVIVAGAPQDTGVWGCDIRTVTGALLVQAVDRRQAEPDTWQHVAGPAASPDGDAVLAWIVAQHAKSNAVALVRDSATVGLGQGETNRIDAVRHALERAGERGRGAVLASDAFFFPDTVEALAAAGVRAAVSPGGSVRDRAVRRAAEACGMTLWFTGERHFRH